MLEYHCPQCFYIPIFDIEDDFKSIKITCLNNHIYKYSISEFLTKNPLKSSKIKCFHCLSSNNNVYDWYYCIKCKVYTCQEDIIKYHSKCKNLIILEKLHSTCLTHNSPYIKLCKTCNKEICNYCILNEHHFHLLSEEMQEIVEKGKFLIKNEKLEKNFYSLIHSKNKKNNNEFKNIYNNLMKLLIKFDKIYLSEIANERFSFILYINMHKMHKSLLLFKREIKSEKIEDVNIENNIKNNFANQFTLFLNNDIDQNYIAFNSKNKILLSIKKNNENEDYLIKISKNTIIK